MKSKKSISIKNIGIGTKLVASIFVIVLVICTVLTSISFAQSSRVLKQSSQLTMTNRAEDNANLISKEIRTYEIAMETLAKREAIVGMDWTVQKPIALSEAARLGIEQIQISSPDGLTHVKDVPAFSLADKGNFKLAMQGVTNTTSPLNSEGDKKLIMITATPIYGDQNSIVGVLGGVVTAQGFNDIVQQIDVGENGYSFVLDKNGVVIAHKDLEIVKNKTNYINEY
ncbi:MAG: cache domain-containing protein, partial [Oscillospiraceae bacterium]